MKKTLLAALLVAGGCAATNLRKPAGPPGRATDRAAGRIFQTGLLVVLRLRALVEPCAH